MEHVNNKKMTETKRLLDTTGRFIKNHKTALCCIGGAVALAPIAFVAAPAIAAAAGGAGLLGATATGSTVISTLGGAALTNASLAAVGGGALATGGGGVVAGTAVITGVGTAAGAVTGFGVKSAVDSIGKRFRKNA